MCCQNTGGMLKPQCLSETRGDIDTYKEMKREKTHTEIEKDAYHFIFRPKNVCALHFTVSDRKDSHC